MSDDYTLISNDVVFASHAKVPQWLFSNKLLLRVL